MGERQRPIEEELCLCTDQTPAQERFCIVANHPQGLLSPPREAGICPRQNLGETEPGRAATSCRGWRGRERGTKGPGREAGGREHKGLPCRWECCVQESQGFPAASQMEALGGLDPASPGSCWQVLISLCPPGDQHLPGPQICQPGPQPFPLGWPNQPDLLRTEGLLGHQLQVFKQGQSVANWGGLVTLFPEAQTPPPDTCPRSALSPAASCLGEAFPAVPPAPSGPSWTHLSGFFTSPV